MVLQELREAEVEDLDDAVLRDHHVLGLQVPVDDPGGVRLGEPVGDLAGDVEQTPGRKRAGPQDLPQRLPVDELHRDEDRGVGGPDVVDRDDVVVIQSGGRARLLLEALVPVGIGGKLRRKHLDRDLAPQPRVPRAIDLAHPSGAERREDLVWAKFLSRNERHGVPAVDCMSSDSHASGGRRSRNGGAYDAPPEKEAS